MSLLLLSKNANIPFFRSLFYYQRECSLLWKPQLLPPKTSIVPSIGIVFATTTTYPPPFSLSTLRTFWLGLQHPALEENLSKNNSKRAYHSWKTWPRWNKEKLLLSKIIQEKASQKNERYWTDGQNTALCCTITRLMAIWSISTALSPGRQRGWPSHPLQRSGGCSTITE